MLNKGFPQTALRQCLVGLNFFFFPPGRCFLVWLTSRVFQFDKELFALNWDQTIQLHVSFTKWQYQYFPCDLTSGKGFPESLFSITAKFVFYKWLVISCCTRGYGRSLFSTSAVKAMNCQESLHKIPLCHSPDKSCFYCPHLFAVHLDRHSLTERETVRKTWNRIIIA